MKILRMFCLQINHTKPPQLCFEDEINYQLCVSKVYYMYIALKYIRIKL